MKNRNKKLDEIITWARNNGIIRAVLQTSSLTNPNAPQDDFSDLDIELVMDDLPAFLQDDSWLSTFGKVIAKVAEDVDAFDGKNAMRMVLYDDYVKVDFKLCSKAVFIAEVNNEQLPEDWDVGYKVLVDKEGLTHHMKAPTYQSVIIEKPTEQRFNQLLNDFWWDMTYVAKCLARDEIFYAKFMSEDMMRTDYLVPMIEWYIAVKHNWNITTNKHGRLFKKYLPPALWQRIEATFSGSDIADNWRALFAYADLGHELGVELAEVLGYQYPQQLENDIRTYLAYVRKY
ncbi:MAG: AadS family aminoglycoside 6-adenylyltransferase [Chitinophaga sp.]|uniref:AadS family aminoglycoside 6-adenylyltransferase n=1 Tax=Chitinophaga sp. TaxID=1869181 RepID=UPI001B1FCD16|nr:AadS family aminoglycoside 6-adenylyltransferase [Chitinophaga sp.]MBO9729750.1 AadS family aminoglycoside 6-adenylyltransferase [Chitinophaga sp.]